MMGERTRREVKLSLALLPCFCFEGGWSNKTALLEVVRLPLYFTAAEFFRGMGRKKGIRTTRVEEECKIDGFCVLAFAVYTTIPRGQNLYVLYISLVEIRCEFFQLMVLFI